MADLTARVTALEEEVGILKGEIKTILQEVRTAVLARENPFTAASADFAPIIPSHEAGLHFSTPDSGNAAMSMPVQAAAPIVPVVIPVAQPQVVSIRDGATEEQQQEEAPAPTANGNKTSNGTSPRATEQEKPARRLSVHTLAALMTWTQEASQRFNVHDLGIVLSIARYGGMLDGDLESTLIKLGHRSALDGNTRRASASDFLLALHQLDAIIEPQADTAPLRKAG